MPEISEELLARLERLAPEPTEEPKYDETGRLIGYVHQAFPVTVYRPATPNDPPTVNHPGFVSAIAESEDELKDALANGWSETYTSANGPVKSKFAKAGPKFAPAKSAKSDAK